VPKPPGLTDIITAIERFQRTCSLKPRRLGTVISIVIIYTLYTSVQTLSPFMM
jgi:hypothetical protein